MPCVFQSRWIEDAEFSTWIAPVERDVKSAFCKVCRKTFSVASMGRQALKSHAEGAGHKRKMLEVGKVGVSQTRLGFSSKDRTESPVTVSTRTSPQKCADVSSYITNATVMKSEILWCLYVTKAHNSFHSCSGFTSILKMIAPDSNIVSRMTIGETKAAYVTSFGIAPYWRQQLTEKMQSASNYVLLFDETYNEVLHKKQLDIHIRFCQDNVIESHYYTSKFMGHGTAAHLVDELYPVCEHLGLSKLLQISMDGPNVNWKLHRDLESKLQQDTTKCLVNVGSCGLHVVHNAVRAGNVAAGWELEEFFTALHYLFKESPARREDYMKITGSSCFAIPFCRHRWVENKSVAERSLEIWPHVKAYIDAVKTDKSKMPKTKSFSRLADCCKDPLLLAKIHAFLSIVEVVQPFLVKYQTDRPMLPFLARDLFQLVICLLRRILTPDSLAGITMVSVKSVDLKDKALHLPSSKIDVGFFATKALKAAKVSELRMMDFRVEVRSFITALLKKLLDKGPLNYSLTRLVDFLDPTITPSMDAQRHFSLVLRKLEEIKQLDGRLCDRLQASFLELQDNLKTNQVEFDPSVDRLDGFWANQLSSKPELLQLFQQLLIISHGQASVERGFSVNRQVLVENKSAETLIAQRTILDHLHKIGGIENVKVTEGMLASVRCSRHRYQKYLDEQKEAGELEEMARKRKAREDEVQVATKKLKLMEDSIGDLNREADSLALQAERDSSFTVLARSNALRSAARKKSLALPSLQEEVNKLKSS